MKALGKGSIASLLTVFLSIASIVLWIALAGVLLAAIGYAIFMGLVAAGILPAYLVQSGGSYHSGGADIAIDAEGARYFAWQVATPALAALFVAVGGWLVIVDRLRRLCANFQGAQPFKRENADHLRVIWITLIVIELSRLALRAITAILYGVFGGPHAKISHSIDLMPWGVILILIVLAEIFREGARMREDQDLTI